MVAKFINEEPHIAEEFKIGNTQVRIADNYCAGKSKEDVEKVLDRIAREILRSFSASCANQSE